MQRVCVPRALLEQGTTKSVAHKATANLVCFLLQEGAIRLYKSMLIRHVHNMSLFLLVSAGMAAFPNALYAGDDAVDAGDRWVQIFGGRYTKETTGDSLNPFDVESENNYVAGIAYGRDWRRMGPYFATGAEMGIAARIADRRSGELWGGLYMRSKGLPLLPHILIKPSVTVGLSLVDRAIGMERVREERRRGNATLLYYFGPELAFSLRRYPEWELVYRLHHRSGGMRTLGNMSEGHNANTFAVRRRF